MMNACRKTPLKLAHVVNVFTSAAGSDARRIQEITLESLKHARQQTGPTVEVELLSAQFAGDRAAVPSYMRLTDDLQRSIQDDVVCADKRELPYIHDILQCACKATDADFLIYTNMDIAVYPGFYSFVADAIESGVDGLAINRAQIPRFYHGKDLLRTSDLDEIYKVPWRRPHIGIDCVMLRCSTFTKWERADLCIGYPPIGQWLLENTERTSLRFVWYWDACQTFHIGIDTPENSPWKRLAGNEIWKRNSEVFASKRLFDENAWKRHGFSRSSWIARRLKWLLKSWLRMWPESK